MRSTSLPALLVLLIAGALGACATAPAPIVERPEAPLFADARFGQPTEPVSTDRVFEVSDAMRHYLQADIAHQLRTEGTKNGLIQALYQKTQLKLEYDSRMTKTAAETVRGAFGQLPVAGHHDRPRSRRSCACRSTTRARSSTRPGAAPARCCSRAATST
jgi:hypothetical protein